MNLQYLEEDRKKKKRQTERERKIANIYRWEIRYRVAYLNLKIFVA